MVVGGSQTGGVSWDTAGDQRGNGRKEEMRDADDGDVDGDRGG